MTYTICILGTVVSLLIMAAGGFLLENGGTLNVQPSVAGSGFIFGMLAFVASIAASFSVDPHRKKAR